MCDDFDDPVFSKDLDDDDDDDDDGCAVEEYGDQLDEKGLVDLKFDEDDDELELFLLLLPSIVENGIWNINECYQLFKRFSDLLVWY